MDGAVLVLVMPISVSLRPSPLDHLLPDGEVRESGSQAERRQVVGIPLGLRNSTR